MIEKIPYLQDLGITAVELLPVFQFDCQDCPPGLVNYWGYSPVSFFAPHAGYSSRKDPLGPVDEFRDLVKALHRAGIEVILDVVYNHTAEGNADGPTLCFRGLANEIYYILDKDRAQYANYSGTGNTLNANQPIVRRMIIDSLRYWVAADACRRFPLRPRLDPGAGRNGSAARKSPGSLGHRVGSRARRHQTDRRGVGRRRPLSSGELYRRQLEGVERAVSGRCPRLCQKRQRDGTVAGAASARQPGYVRAPGTGARAKHQLCDLP